tara:strand:- start:1029 stop:1178 length:150 start_codon:yes stop_codon:yes gene_type:complete
MENLKSTNKTAEEYAKEQARTIWDSWIVDSTDSEETELEYSKEDSNEDI